MQSVEYRPAALPCLRAVVSLFLILRLFAVWSDSLWPACMLLVTFDSMGMLWRTE